MWSLECFKIWQGDLGKSIYICHKSAFNLFEDIVLKIWSLSVLDTHLVLFYPIPLVLSPKSPKFHEGGSHSLSTSTADNSKGLQWDLGLEIVQAIIGLLYHGLGTNFGPSCKCVWDHCPAGRWCCKVFTLSLRSSQFTKRTVTRCISMAFFKWQEWVL